MSSTDMNKSRALKWEGHEAGIRDMEHAKNFGKKTSWKISTWKTDMELTGCH
jgi:hypothetical protein